MPYPKHFACLSISSVQFSCSVVSDSLRPYGLQHDRPPCPSPTPGARSNSFPLSQWCHSTISSSVIPFASHLQSFPGSGSFPMSQLFASGVGVSASTSTGSSKKQESSRKNIYFCFIDYAKAFDCVDHNKLWKILQEMRIPNHLTCLLRNLSVGQEELDIEQQYWSFSFNISPSNEHSGLISFKMDWLYLLAVQGTPKSLLQHHS